MESGLEDRNNTLVLQPHHSRDLVSMESGLEDRNNIRAPEGARPLCI